MDTLVKEMEIKRLAPEDLSVFSELTGLFTNVFETGKTVTADDKYLMTLLNNPDFVAIAIVCRNQVVGGATGYRLPMYISKSAELFIYDVAVDPAYQRQGLGTKLLTALKEYCQQNDIELMFVPANEEDVHALNFYQATGGQGEKVVQFSYNTLT